ncbi:MAG: sugar-binding domain-containing protein, partial [bacterium]
MDQLYTRWKPEEGKVPFPEYPRPQMRRDRYQILNGVWSYAFTGEDERPEDWDGEILVPFSPETALSGVGRTLQPGQFLHYFRTFEASFPAPGERLLLHFGAVDQRCRVRVNGREAGSHEGGFTAFSIDVTDLVREGENTLEVACRDDTDTSW